MSISEQAAIYWTISQIWHNPATKRKMTFGEVAKQLRAIQTESRSITMRVRAKKLLDDICSNTADPKSP